MLPSSERSIARATPPRAGAPARSARGARGLAATLTALGALACTGGKAGPSLSKSETGAIPNVPVPAENGPKLGATANLTPVRERPSRTAPELGYLHAGALVARAEKPYSTDGCSGGWFPIRPRGFVCLDEGATLDTKHPTLQVMAIRAKLDAPLPYTYARTLKKTTLWERDPKRPDGIREAGELPRRSTLAVVGSWVAKDAEGKERRLALMPAGSFVSAEDLEAATPSSFRGTELQGVDSLPLAFVVKQGVRAWRIDGDTIDKLDLLKYHDRLKLTGKFRTFQPAKYWAVDDGRHVRHQDVTVIRPRHVFPDKVSDDQKWIDISVITGTLVLYEGRRPIYATLVSVGRDRTGDPKTSASTALGTFEVTKKHITACAADPKTLADDVAPHDVPWALELSSGQLIHAAPWHDRFGIEHGLGHVALSVADAAHVWHWADPVVPDGWHAASAEDAKKTLVVVRK